MFISKEYEDRIMYAERGQWVTQSGEVINVEDMSDYHIDACLKMLENRDDYLSEIQRDMFHDEQLRRYKRFYDGIMGGEKDD